MGAMIEITNDEGRWVVQIDAPRDLETRIGLDLREKVHARRRPASATTYTVAGHRVTDLKRFCLRLHEEGVAVCWDDTPNWIAR